MKPVDFDLHRPSTLAETLGLLGALDGVRTDGTAVRIGAMVRRSQAERSPMIAARCSPLAAALPWIAHPPIRTRGTIGGSLAHADPAAELPAVAVALGATLIATRSVPGHAPGSTAGSTGAVSTRAVGAGQFYQGYLTTALAPEELLTEIGFPAAVPHTGAAFAEVARRRGDFALVGCAAQVTLAGGLIADARICLSGVAGVPVRGTTAEELLRRRPLDDTLLTRAADDLAASLSPPTDLHGSGEYRRHLAAVLIRRTVTQAHERAQARSFTGVP